MNASGLIAAVQGLKPVLPILGSIFAACAGYCGWISYAERARIKMARKRITGANLQPVFTDKGKCQSKHGVMIERLKLVTRLLEHGQIQSLCIAPLRQSSWFRKTAASAGLSKYVTENAFCEVRFRMAAFGAVAGLVVGCVFSATFAAMLSLVGALLGWRIPKSAVERLRNERTEDIETRLPEMLDILGLGMRSGLSFDSALRLYCTHMDCELAQELSIAQKLWMSGLEDRDQALRQLASSYGSSTFERVIEMWIRSLRHGTSMAEGLENEGRQARVAYKAKREEQVAKAPVKMMIPTGALILPAMLILVLGPVFLELMNGGV